MMNTQNKKRVVIIGSGFAGLAAARELRKSDMEIFLIDRRNHHVFQPLLYQVATAALSPAQIAQPIRSIMRKQKNCSVILGQVTGVDKTGQRVLGKSGELSYDFLVIATGATHTYFGNDNWAQLAPGLKSIEDATLLRQRILSAFEKAEICDDEAERQSLMTFVIVGGGPTGVEMAGAIAELAHHTLKDNFRHIDPAQARILLAEGSDRILQAFSPQLSKRAERDLTKLGVSVRTGQAIKECATDGVLLGEEWIAAHTIIWAAGVKASPAGQWLEVECDRAGRVIVEPDLTIKEYQNIFVIGDTALVHDQDGRPVPGLAPAAMQQGSYVARSILSRFNGEKETHPFIYKNWGTMATIGRGMAIADFGKFTCAGFIAWCLWGAIHLMPLVGFRNRLVVACDWLWSYFTHERGVRLITISRDTESEI